MSTLYIFLIFFSGLEFNLVQLVQHAIVKYVERIQPQILVILVAHQCTVEDQCLSENLPSKVSPGIADNFIYFFFS